MADIQGQKRLNLSYSRRGQQLNPLPLKSVSSLPEEGEWESVDHAHAGDEDQGEVPCTPEEEFIRAILIKALDDARSDKEELALEAVEFFVDEPLVQGFIQAANLPENSYDTMLEYIGLLQKQPEESDADAPRMLSQRP